MKWELLKLRSLGYLQVIIGSGMVSESAKKEFPELDGFKTFTDMEGIICCATRLRPGKRRASNMACPPSRRWLAKMKCNLLRGVHLPSWERSMSMIGSLSSLATQCGHQQGF